MGDGESGDPHTRDRGAGGGTLRGTFVRADTGDGIGPFPVALFDLDRLVAVDRVVSDDSGAFVFEAIEPGSYLPVMISDLAALFALPRPRYEFTGDEIFEDLFPLGPLPNQSVGGQPIVGTVVDDTTGERIPFARVEMTSLNDGSNWSQNSSSWSEFRGDADQQEPIANAQGEFRIDPTPTVFVPDPSGTGDPTPMHPSWRVTAPGYKAKNFSTRPIGFGDLIVTVRLERGRDEGVFTGRVIGFDGLPREGVQVVAEWRRATGELFKAAEDLELIISEGFGISDASGVFRIEGMPGGFYNILAGARGDDGWVGPAAPPGAGRPGNNLGGLQAVELLDATTVDVGDLIVVPTIELIDPLPGETYVRGDVLSWTPIDGASEYTVLLRRGFDLQAVIGTFTSAEFTIENATPPFDLSSLIRLEIIAEDSAGQALSRTDRPLMLQYEPERSVGIGK